MSNATALLNEIARNLGTDKNETISFAIQVLVNEYGFTVREATDGVMGDGAYDRLAATVLA